MKTNSLLGFLLLFILTLNLSCSNDDDSNGDPIVPEEQNVFLLNDELTDWINFYNVADQPIRYKNGDDSFANVIVRTPFDENSELFIDCVREERSMQCQIENVTLEFSERTHPTSNSIALTAFIMSQDELRLMPINGGGIGLSAARLTENTGDIRTESEDNFEVNYQTDYVYNNEVRKAIFITTTSIDNLPTGGTIPPQRLIYVKGIGIVEYDDYNGNTWILVE